MADPLLQQAPNKELSLVLTRVLSMYPMLHYSHKQTNTNLIINKTKLWEPGVRSLPGIPLSSRQYLRPSHLNHGSACLFLSLILSHNTPCLQKDINLPSEHRARCTPTVGMPLHQCYKRAAGETSHLALNQRAKHRAFTGTAAKQKLLEKPHRQARLFSVGLPEKIFPTLPHALYLSNGCS